VFRAQTMPVSIFPNPAAVVRLVRAILAEQHDEWQVGRHSFGAESLAAVVTAEQPRALVAA
jgi:putative transposase